MTEILLLVIAASASALCLERFQGIELAIEKSVGFTYTPVGLNVYMVMLLAAYSTAHMFVLCSRLFRPHPWTRWQLLRRLAPLVMVLGCTIGVFAYLHSGLAVLVWRQYL